MVFVTIVCVVDILTTEGINLSARSANDSGISFEFTVNEELQNKNLFIEVEKKKYPIQIINKPLKQTNFKNN